MWVEPCIDAIKGRFSEGKSLEDLAILGFDFGDFV